MRLRLATMAAIVLAFALLASACGGPMSKSEYQKEVRKIGERAEKQLNTILKGSEPPSAGELEKAANVFNDTADELDELEPPKEVKKYHDRMVKGMRGLGAGFSDLSDKLDGAKTKKAQSDVFLKAASNQKLEKAFTDLRSSQEGFRKKGYSVFDDSDDGETGTTGGGATGDGAPPEPPAAPGK